MTETAMLRDARMRRRSHNSAKTRHGVMFDFAPASNCIRRSVRSQAMVNSPDLMPGSGCVDPALASSIARARACSIRARSSEIGRAHV